jgi:hypothetical protein
MVFRATPRKRPRSKFLESILINDLRAFDQPQRQFERSRNEQTFGMNGGGYGRQYGAPR